MSVKVDVTTDKEDRLDSCKLENCTSGVYATMEDREIILVLNGWNSFVQLNFGLGPRILDKEGWADVLVVPWFGEINIKVISEKE